MEHRMECWIFRRRSGTALFPPALESIVWLSNGQRGCPEAVAALTSFLDEADYPRAEVHPGIRTRHAGVSRLAEPPRTGLRPGVRKRQDPDRQQFVEFRAGRGDRPSAFQRFG